MPEKNDERRCFEARTGAWPEVREFLERRCRDLKITRSPALRLELVAEELFLNAAEHGVGNLPGEAICMAIMDVGPEVELVLEDRGPEFNPFADIEAASDSKDPEARPVGRLGRPLVVGLAARCQYRRFAGRNRVTVAVLKSAGAGKHLGAAGR